MYLFWGLVASVRIPDSVLVWVVFIVFIGRVPPNATPPLIRPYFFGAVAFGGVPLDSYDVVSLRNSSHWSIQDHILLIRDLVGTVSGLEFQKKMGKSSKNTPKKTW